MCKLSFPLKFFELSLSICSLEVEGLVRGEESHELWNDLNTDHTGFVDIEVSPGPGEVGGEVLLNITDLSALMGFENLSSGELSSLLVNPEVAIGLAGVLDFFACFIFLANLTLEGVVLDHGSHEDIIITSGESNGGDSLILIELSTLSVVEWLVVVTVEHNELDWIIRRHGVSGVGLGDGVGTIRLDQTRVGSVIVDGSQVPDGSLGSGDGSEEGSNSELH